MPDLTVTGTGWVARSLRAMAPAAGWRLVDGADPPGTLATGVGATGPEQLADRLRSGRPTLVGAPLGASPAEADALVGAAEAGGGLSGYAEPLVLSPLVAVGVAHRRGLGPVRRLALELAGLPDGSAAADPLEELGPSALALIELLAPPARPVAVRAAAEGDVTRLRVRCSDDLETSVELRPAGSPPQWSAEVASDHGVVRVELLPGASVESQGLDVTPPPVIEGADPILDALGVGELLRDFSRAASGRGGRVCPLGFGRRIRQLLTASATARDRGTEEPLPD